MKFLNKISPKIHYSGNKIFKKGIINPWRVISDHEYFIFEEGEGRLIIDGIEYNCPEKSFIIIPPGKCHISYCDSDSMFLHWVHFDWTNLNLNKPTKVFIEPAIVKEEYLHLPPDFIPHHVLKGKIRDPHVFLLLKQINIKSKSNNQRDYMLLSPLILELSIRLFTPQNRLNKESYSMNNYLSVEEIRQKLTIIANDPINEVPPLKEILAINGYSYSHQERIFKQTFGVTPHKYLTLLRVELIKQFLENKRITIGDIAYKMGFNDLAYFSRYVQKHLGESPRSWRNKYHIHKWG